MYLPLLCGDSLLMGANGQAAWTAAVKNNSFAKEDDKTEP